MITLSLRRLQSSAHTSHVTAESLKSTVYFEASGNYWSDECTSPRGVEPRLFTEEVHFQVDIAGTPYTPNDTEIDGYQVMSVDDMNDDDDEQFANLIGYAVYSWGVGGNHPDRTTREYNVYTSDTEAELAIYDDWYKSMLNSTGRNDVTSCYSNAEELNVAE
jgi:hypothetical protein